MTGIIGAIIGATGFGTANIVIKKSLSTLTIPQTLMMSTLSGIFFLTIFALLSHGFADITLSTFLAAIALAGGETCLYLILYKTFDVSNVTVAAAVSGTYPLLSTLVTALLFSEFPSQSRLFFIFLLVVGGIVTSIDWNGVFKNGFDKKDLVKGFGWIVATTFIHALYFPLLGGFTANGAWQTKLLLIKIVSAILLFIVFFVIRKQSVLPSKDRMPFTSLLGLLEVIGWAGYSWASNSTDEQKAVLIAALNSSSLVTAILAYFFLNEKLSKFQYLGIIMIIVSLTGLSF
ncbi:MAG: EamA family transporter [Patescibacteria group bacterium]